MNTLAANIKNLMISLNINESELSRQTSVGQPVIHKIAKGVTKNPSVETLLPIAKFFGVSIEALMEDYSLCIRDVNSVDSVLNKQWIEIPITSWDSVGMSSATAMENVDPQDFVRIDTDSKIVDNAYALIIEDSSMEPAFLKGTVLVVDPNLKAIDRDYVVVRFNDHHKAMFRQILFSGDFVYLKSLNADFQIVEMSQNCRILGVVIQGVIQFKR